MAEYLIDFNATQAAVRAGYSPRSHDHRARLLAQPAVAAAIREGVKTRAARLSLDGDDLLLRALALYDMATAAVPVTKWDAASKTRVETGAFTIDGALAAKAIELMGKLLGAFRDRPAQQERPFVVRIEEE